MDDLEIILAKARQIHQAIKASGYFPNDLEGACAVASVELFKFGKNLGIPILFAYNDLWHCFNVIGTDVENALYIVDITASQFDFTYADVVAVEKFTPKKRRYFWRIDGCASSLNEFSTLAKETLQFDARWYSQNPNIYEFSDKAGDLKLEHRSDKVYSPVFV